MMAIPTQTTGMSSIVMKRCLTARQKSDNPRRFPRLVMHYSRRTLRAYQGRGPAAEGSKAVEGAAYRLWRPSPPGGTQGTACWPSLLLCAGAEMWRRTKSLRRLALGDLSDEPGLRIAKCPSIAWVGTLLIAHPRCRTGCLWRGHSKTSLLESELPFGSSVASRHRR